MKTYKNNQTGIFQKQEDRGRGDILEGMYKGVHKREKSISDDEVPGSSAKSIFADQTVCKARSFLKIPKAKKALGQNFLIDEAALTDIAGAIEISGKHILEIGPGYGALTDYLLAQNPTSLDLIELDRDMIAILEGKYTPEELTINHIDVLRYIPTYETYSVIANIPYYITSPILFYFLYELANAPDEMVIMMQEEVGEKILEGRARKPHHSFLSLCMEQSCEDIEVVRYVGRSSFDPAPRVDSIVLRFIVKKDRNRDQEQQLIKLWKVAFAHPRKTLLSNIKGSTYSLDAVRSGIIQLGYDERVRAEAIRRDDWISFL